MFHLFDNPLFFSVPRRLTTRSILDNFFDDSLDLFLNDCSKFVNYEDKKRIGISKKSDNENKLVKSNKDSNSLNLFNSKNPLNFKAEWKDDEQNNSKKLVLSNLPSSEGSKVDVRIDGNMISVSCEESTKKESKGFKSYSSSRVEKTFSIPKGVDSSNVSNASPSNGVIEIIFPKDKARELIGSN